MDTSTPLKYTGKIDTTPASSKLKLTPSFPNSVFLYDWWLIKADKPSNGRLLGVGGLSSKEHHGVRVLHSDAIVKRHNTNTVETSDGLTISFSGSINKRRTVLNGFPSEVCDQFIFGFPYCWEELVSKSFTKKASKSAVDNSGDAANNFLSKSFDNLPSSLIRDFLAPTIESSGSCKAKHIFGDMLLHAHGPDSLNNQSSDFVYPSEKTSRVLGRRQKDEEDTAAGANKPRKKTQIFPREPGTDSLTSCVKVACDKPDKGKLLAFPGKHQSMKKSRGSKNSSDLRFTTRTLSLRNRSIDILIRGAYDKTQN